jgi:ketosteroid isomerase-like protein
VSLRRQLGIARAVLGRSSGIVVRQGRDGDPRVAAAPRDDVAFAHCLYKVSGSLGTGVELGMWNRATFCLRKIDREWRIVHEHDSVPFDPETGEASVGLEPT